MKINEEDEVTLEIEQLNKIIEKDIKLEILLNQKLEDTENYIKNHDWKDFFDLTYLFKQNIERVWDSIKSLDFIFNEFNDNDSENYPFIFKRGSNVYNFGNIFEGKIFNEYEFIAKVIKQKVSSDIKKIEWIFHLGNGDDFRLLIILYKVTEDNSTVINLKSKYINSIGENILLKLKQKFNGNLYIKTIEKMIKKDSAHLEQYESGIIQGNLEEIWEILTDNSKLVSIAPNNDIFLPININKVKVGDICKLPMNIRNIAGYIEIKLDIKEDTKGWNKLAFGYSILGGGPFKVIKQSLLIQLNIINKHETQLSIYTKIHESIAKKKIKNLSEKKKYVITSIKDYFENFSTPKDNINNINN